MKSGIQCVRLLGLPTRPSLSAVDVGNFDSSMVLDVPRETHFSSTFSQRLNIDLPSFVRPFLA